MHKTLSNRLRAVCWCPTHIRGFRMSGIAKENNWMVTGHSWTVDSYQTLFAAGVSPEATSTSTLRVLLRDRVLQDCDGCSATS